MTATSPFPPPLCDPSTTAADPRYNRDFHEEKELLFDSLTMANRATSIVPPLVRSTQFNTERMEELCDGNFMTATELANYLVAEHNVPFRATHHIVGSLVGDLTRKGENLTNIDAVMDHLADNEHWESIAADRAKVTKVLNPKQVMMTYNSYGGTGPAAVADILADINGKLDDAEAALTADRARVTTAHAACKAIAAECGSVETLDDLQALIAKHRPNSN